MRLIERTALRRADLVVTVTQDMVDGYFRDTQRLRNVRYAVIENRVDPQETPDSIERDRQPETDDALTIGYFGVIRCERSWEALLSAARQAQGRIRVIVRGIPLGMPDFEQQCAEAEYVTYGGSFISPDDLPQMYADVDMVWAAYLHGESNARWARSNRYFEAGYFRKPVFVQQDTRDGDAVADSHTGMLVDLHDIEGTAQAILRVTPTDVVRWSDAVESRPVEDFVLTNNTNRSAKLWVWWFQAKTARLQAARVGTSSCCFRSARRRRFGSATMRSYVWELR